MAEIVTDPSTPSVPASPAVVHVDALPPGARLAEFEVQGLLGVGGFGLVYRAYDTSLHRAVAIKEYMPAALAGRIDGASVSVRSSGDQASYESGLQSFVAEARLLAQFDHPSLVKVYRIWEANNTAYMVMPLYSGVTLGQARAQMVSPPPEIWLRTVMWSILQALHVLHQHDTLHRDVSPDNIFLQDVGPPVLLDLGAARRAISDKSQRLTAVLKVNYAPIEQYAETTDLAQGPWSDLYALAAVVYNCLRNAPPLPATARVVSDSMPTVRSVAATVKEHFGIEYSDPFVRTIAHALAVRPADRPQSLAAFVTEMKLKAPPRLSKFDWRAELGAALRSADDENHSRQFWQTQPQTLLDPARPRAGTTSAGWRAWQAPRGWRRRGLVMGLVALMLGTGILLAGRGQRADTPLIVTSEPAAMPAPAPVASEPLGAAQGAVTAVAPSPTVEEVVRPPAPPVGKRDAASARGKPAAKPASLARAAGPEVASRPAQAAEARVSTSRELCADANFFTRPMCIHLECQKAENVQLPACIEDRKRYPSQP